MPVERLRIIHLTVGIITILVFLGTGAFMRFIIFPEAYQSNEAIRFLYRANHVYILFIGMLNALLGLYLRQGEEIWKRRLQMVGSWVIAVVPAVFILAFFLEPPTGSAFRPITSLAVFSTGGAVLLHLITLLRPPRGDS